MSNKQRVDTSLDLAKRDEILPGLRQVQWDLVIVDEAHRMSARDESHKSLRYKLTELLQRTDEEIGRATIDVDIGKQGAEGRLAKAEKRQDELIARRECRREELGHQRARSIPR